MRVNRGEPEREIKLEVCLQSMRVQIEESMGDILE